MKSFEFRALSWIGVLSFLFSVGTLVGQEQTSRRDLTTFPIILEPFERTAIYPEISAKIVKINVRLGDSFEKGDLLLEMENRVYQAQVNKAEKIVLKAEQDLKVKKNLYDEKLISLLELREAEANLASAVADQEIAKKTFDATQIIAPYSGKVTAVNAHLYEISPKDKPLMEIIDDRTLLAKFILPSSYLPLLDKGDTIYIRIKELDRIIPAKISRFGAEINPVSGTLTVEAEIDNSTENLISGLSSRVAFSESAFSVTNEEDAFKELLNEMGQQKRKGQPSVKPQEEN